MREVIEEIETWLSSGKAVAIATNVRKKGPSLRPLGAKMVMTNSVQIAGSVTGGCIEASVYDEAQAVIKSRTPKLLHFDVLDVGNPSDIGLSCGGTLDVLIESLDSPSWQEIYPTLKTCLEQNELVAVVTLISRVGQGNKMLVWMDNRRLGSLGDAYLDDKAVDWARKQMRMYHTGWTTLENVEVFVDVLSPPERLMVVGAVHIAIPLVILAKVLGFQTIVIDPRKAFANRERFPHADKLFIQWPTEILKKLYLDDGTYIVALSHDEKLDNPALAIALASPARYIGVLGAHKNIPDRFRALKQLGVTEKQLESLRAPVGMNLGAILPEEIALSIMAEIVAERHGIQRSCEH